MCRTEIYLYREGENNKAIDHQEVFESLKGDSLVVSLTTDFFQFQIAGMIIVNNKPIVVFPRGYQIPVSTESIKRESRFLLKSLLRYSETRREPVDTELLHGSSINQNGRIISALSLLEDYAKNGLIRRKIANESGMSNGFINWAKTINEKTPVISNNSVYYFDLSIKSLEIDKENLLSMIHRQVIFECDNLFGWLTDYAFAFDPIPSLNTSYIDLVYFLRQELQKTFVQREVYVINLLIQYLSSQIGNSEHKKFEIFATRYFQNIWEDMCASLLKNEYQSLKLLVPSARWVDGPCDPSIRQIPDILFIDRSSLYIVDAKFYDYNFSTPGWHDIVKQFFYYHTINSNLKENIELTEIYQSIQKIYNIFLLPENAPVDIKSLGSIHMENVSSIGAILVFSINIKRSLEIYAKRETSSLRELLIEYVEHSINW